MGIPVKVIKGVLWLGPISGASGAAGHYGSRINLLTEVNTQQAIQIDELDIDYNNLQQQPTTTTWQI